MGVQPIEKNKKELQKLALQLSCPSGKVGVQLAKEMNEDNASMIDTAADTLEIKKQDFILELGYGNAGHLSRMYRKMPNFGYRGLEISETMKAEAEQINHIFINNKDIKFGLYDGVHIPYQRDRFSKILTVNTIYFWQNPVKLFEEMYRVLKPGGVLSLVFATKDFMKTLAFTNFGFKLYEIDEWSGFFLNAGFIEDDIAYYNEKIISKEGNWVEREYVCVILKK